MTVAVAGFEREAVKRLAVLLLFSLTSASASAEPPAKPPPKHPCARKAYRQFDFWKGRWEVRDLKGKVLGHNRIDVILQGCALQENWKSASGKSVGHSFNTVGPDGKWHQTWVDNQGTLLRLTGGLDAKGRMVLSETITGADGKETHHEISWTPNADGTVRQHWRTSTDGKKTFQDAFVGIYRRQK